MLREARWRVACLRPTRRCRFVRRILILHVGRLRGHIGERLSFGLADGPFAHRHWRRDADTVREALIGHGSRAPGALRKRNPKFRAAVEQREEAARIAADRRGRELLAVSPRILA